MLAITVKSEDRDPYKFEWDASAEEGRNLWDEIERQADSAGHDPLEIATAAIVQARPPKDEIAERGYRMWLVYAVLRSATDRIDLTDFIDHAGVLEGPPTIFDLAEHQQIKAEISVDTKNKQFTMELAGRSPLDS